MILSIQDVVKRYSSHVALDRVSLEIPKGKIFGLLGPNGAGKTSLIRIITQITAPDEGQILFDGERLSSKHVEQIGYLPEERGLYKKMKVGEQLIYLAQLKGLTRQEATTRLKDWFIRLDIKEWWDKQVDDLSKGMQQKTQFISTVVHEPKLLILDEPFSGFDPINANMLKDEILALKDRGTSILFSTHRMESVEELCDSIALINHSKVVLTGEKDEVRNRFKAHQFEVLFEGDLTQELKGVDLISLEMSGNQSSKKAIFKLQEAVSPNHLLGQLIPQVQIQKFQELIPSFNDIFIQVVQETN
ncbi:ABC transporter ATP-binding protein [Aquirufa ecclesiirivi]|uniref:ABC transporter ATP-binding protein n=1 Tax=Aquirufa ecclesiirivi TaxID=2715124 RepID=A0ABT4JC08_9BACT|nr:ATP-binding cassette domain-containing protein [Aquirufa ecclesiirivi]MCZ2472495.1 ABC transporter ATP-binding protein [Aquirufa ecclesiirivi]MCZ2473825.1 ABC transporter ATP-binding protein [Aquirufa ecclesiirivi]MDF0694741.1 ATP-binding cassette domain-containing protein [Aquirufa ecclesiirivi]NHC50282.1 ABC transporter ATP-binding protein [Aquirufa ecclesiirivi]